MRFDQAYHPVVMGKTLFVASSRNDSVRALDTETGAERWRFHADGPIRFAPVAWHGKLYVCSDDGRLYCLNAANGKLVWTFRAGPSDRRLLGNGRLCSAWPVRGAPVIADGTCYLGASIWPFMGIFLYALDAETGKVVWAKDGLGSMYTLRPHVSPAFSGLAPQGYLAVSGEYLLVPNGRTRVACLDRKTGTLIHHRATRSGTYHIAAAGKFYFNAGVMFETATGRPLQLRSNYAVALTDDTIYTSGVYYVRAYPVAEAAVEERRDRRDRPYHVATTSRAWRLSLPHFVSSLIKAGGQLYAGGPEHISAVQLPGDDGEPDVAWQKTVDGTVVDLVAADGKLFAVTLDGKILCYGAKRRKPLHYAVEKAPAAERKGPVEALAARILKATDVQAGYAVVLGVEDGRLIEALASQSRLHVIAVGKDRDEVAAARKRLDAAGLYGHRAVVLDADPLVCHLPPYVADLVTTEDLKEVRLDKADGRFAAQAFQVLRPYGGAVCVQLVGARENLLAASVDAAKLAGVTPKVLPSEGLEWFVRRNGPRGADDWTHQYADAANTAMSEDDLVRTPLGLLWFGGPSNREVLPRHGHGPSPQVVAGRLFIEGPDMLRAVDVYTGRLLWQKDLPGVGAAYDNTAHQPGANATGSNYVSLRDGVYVAYGRQCLRLDPATGRQVAAFKLPRTRGQTKDPQWGFLTIYRDFLIAGAEPLILSPFFREQSIGRSPLGMDLDGTSSERIVVMNRHSGKVLWQVRARHGFVHNSIIGGAGKVFCIDRPRVPRGILEENERGEARPVRGSRLLVFDAATGKKAWSTDKDVFGTWLAYSKKHNLLLEAGRASRDMLWDEPDSRMTVYKADSGKVVWDKRWDRGGGYRGPCMLHGDTILTQFKAYSLLTGERVLRTHPLTGQKQPWRYTRNYGCGTPRAGRHLLTFRSAAAGYYDLARDGGTGNLGGFKSGCTSNLIPANGVLNAPDYTRTCTCGYPNQSSLAMIHMPENEMWTFNDLEWDGAPIRRMGLNLGAPGDRRAQDGTLWLEFPYVGGPSPDLPVRLDPDAIPEKDPRNTPGRFVRHTSRVRAGDRPWVAASGLKGIRRLIIPLASPVIKTVDAEGQPLERPRPLGPRPYMVRLYFCEPDGLRSGGRVFDVKVQGKTVLRKFDLVEEAGGADLPVVREVRRVRVKDNLTVELVPREGSAEPLLCGIEVLADGW
jgi:outer membrane protein assembly factor BamB